MTWALQYISLAETCKWRMGCRSEVSKFHWGRAGTPADKSGRGGGGEGGQLVGGRGKGRRENGGEAQCDAISCNTIKKSRLAVSTQQSWDHTDCRCLSLQLQPRRICLGRVGLALCV